MLSSFPAGKEDQTATEKAAASRAAIDLSAVKAEVNNDFAVKETPKEPADQTAAEKIRAANAEKMKVDNLNSAVIYRGIFPGADLEYVVGSSRIKENIYCIC